MDVKKIKEAMNKRNGKDVLVELEIIYYLINEAEKTIRYENALKKIATTKMSCYLSKSHMNQNFIEIANEVLENI